MNDKTDNIQVTMDGISEMLSEIKREVKSLKSEDNGEAALKTDLLNKIIQIIDESKKSITAEELQTYSTAVAATMRQLQEEANTGFTERFNGKMGELQKLVQTARLEKKKIYHCISIDIKSSWVTLVLTGLAMLSVVLSCVIYRQREENKKLEAGNWKYRYVMMAGGISSGDAFRLNRIFSSPDSIRIAEGLKKPVLDYEQRLRERIEKEEQIERNNKANKKLNREINKLKNKYKLLP